MSASRPRLAEAGLLGVALIWGCNVPLMKIALRELDPFAFNAVRLALSAIFLGWLAHREARHRPRQPLDARCWRRIITIGLIGSLFYQLMFITGVDRTTAGNVGLIIASMPLWTALLARLAGIERNTRTAWLGLGIAFAGVVWVTCEGGKVDLSLGTFQGNLLVLAACITWSIATILSKHLVGTISPTRLAYLTAISVAPIHLLIGAPGLGPVFRMEISATAWGCIVFSGLLSTGLAYVLWNFGLRQVGPSRTAVFNNLVPIITLITSVGLLHETITAWQIGGGALVIGGLVVMRR